MKADLAGENDILKFGVHLKRNLVVYPNLKFETSIEPCFGFRWCTIRQIYRCLCGEKWPSPILS